MAVLKSVEGDKDGRRQDIVLDLIIPDDVRQFTCTGTVKCEHRDGETTK